MYHVPAFDRAPQSIETRPAEPAECRRIADAEPEEADSVREKQSLILFDTLFNGPFFGWFDVGGPEETGGLSVFRVEGETAGQLLDDEADEIHLTVRQRLYVIDGDKDACRNASAALRQYAEDLCIAATAIETAAFQDALCRMQHRDR